MRRRIVEFAREGAGEARQVVDLQGDGFTGHGVLSSVQTRSRVADLATSTVEKLVMPEVKRAGFSESVGPATPRFLPTVGPVCHERGGGGG